MKKFDWHYFLGCVKFHGSIFARGPGTDILWSRDRRAVRSGWLWLRLHQERCRVCGSVRLCGLLRHGDRGGVQCVPAGR